MKVSLVSLGCRTNQAEMQQIEADLRRAGHQIVSLASSPDLCIVNTCAVTGRAEGDSRRLIRKALEKAAKVVATGCFVELGHLSSDISRAEHLLAVKNRQKDFIARVVGPAPSCDASPLSVSAARHRPIVKIQDGCNSSCSYCVVPLARGESRSVPAEDIIDSVMNCHSEGFGEVVLSGIHLGTYGRDLRPPTTLARLLKTLLVRTQVARIRLSSIESGEIDDELLETLAEERLCRHLHVPLQSGDDAVLRAMNRPYRTESFVATLDKLLSLLPNLALGTDIMVGFPGEGPAEFLRTVSVVHQTPFAYLHVFPYSPRPGTTAARLSGQVPESEKKRRVEELRGISTKKKIDHIGRNLGLMHQALVERARGVEHVCTTGNYIKALVTCPSGLVPGSLVDVVLTGCEGDMARAIPAR